MSLEIYLPKDWFNSTLSEYQAGSEHLLVAIKTLNTALDHDYRYFKKGIPTTEFLNNKKIISRLTEHLTAHNSILNAYKYLKEV